jgi:hypothetical protein
MIVGERSGLWIKGKRRRKSPSAAVVCLIVCGRWSGEICTEGGDAEKVSDIAEWRKRCRARYLSRAPIGP